MPLRFPRRGLPPLCWDGAVGTELIARGLDLAIEPPEAWTRARPDVLLDVHTRYIDAQPSAAHMMK